jgi:hypothetical protein
VLLQVASGACQYSMKLAASRVSCWKLTQSVTCSRSTSVPKVSRRSSLGRLRSQGNCPCASLAPSTASMAMSMPLKAMRAVCSALVRGELSTTWGAGRRHLMNSRVPRAICMPLSVSLQVSSTYETTCNVISQ